MVKQVPPFALIQTRHRIYASLQAQVHSRLDLGEGVQEAVDRCHRQTLRRLLHVETSFLW